jgi:hypothetical protein
MNSLANTFVLGLILGLVLAAICGLVLKRTYWQINMLIGFVSMGLCCLVDRILPGGGLFVALGTGLLAALTVTRKL